MNFRATVSIPRPFFKFCQKVRKIAYLDLFFGQICRLLETVSIWGQTIHKMCPTASYSQSFPSVPHVISKFSHMTS